MLALQCLAGRGILGGQGLPVGIERELRIHQHLPATGEVHDEIRSRRAVLAGPRGLPVEVGALEETGVLEQALELHLAPLAAALPAGQRRRDLGRRGLQRLVALLDGLQLRRDRGFGCRARPGRVLRGPPHAVEAGAHRLQQVVERPRARLLLP